MHTNGEARLLRVIAELDPRTVFDVGANVGEWSSAALRALPLAQVHAFEPVSSTFEACRRSLASWGDRAVTNHRGLAESDSDRTIYVDPARHTVASLLAPVVAESSATVTDIGATVGELCRFTTGDAYADVNGVASVDMLKTDTEGCDHQVLRGCVGLLGRRAIRIVQFEYGPWAFNTRYLLADHVDAFAAFGYRVGRLYPDGVHFREHSARYEDFRLANYVAIHETDEAARDLLRG
jgi:FkbM family methyltransferase